jgi:hypothetical protein
MADLVDMGSPSSNTRISRVGEAKLLDHIVGSLTLLRMGHVFRQT